MMYINTCKVCNKEFKHLRKSTLCSINCKDEFYLEYNRLRNNTFKTEKTCDNCEKKFITTYSKKKFCCSACRIEKVKKTHVHTSIEFKIFNRDDFTCIYCGKNSITDKIVLEIDHVYPLSKGGDNSDFNLVTSCKNCNRTKSNDFISEKSLLKIWNKNLLKESRSFKELKNNLNI